MPLTTAAPQPDLLTLQNRIGNTEVQRLLRANAVQREADDAAQPAAATPDVAIQAPTVDYYDVTGSTLAEVFPQLDPIKWGRCIYHFDYDYDTTNGKVTAVRITLRLEVRMRRCRAKLRHRRRPRPRLNGSACAPRWKRMRKGTRRSLASGRPYFANG